MIKVFIDKERDGPENMAIDFALAEHCEKKCNLLLRLYGWSPPCFSLGRFQSSDIIDHDYLKSRNYGFVRRPTGGGAVLHLSEITYSVVSRKESSQISVAGAELYIKVGRALDKAIRTMGVPTQISKMKPPRREEVCFGSSSVGEITVDGRKIVGSAQMRSGNSILQHGSIIVRAAPSIYSRCFRDSRTTALIRTIAAEMCGIEDCLEHDIDVEAFKEAIIKSFENVFQEHATLASIEDEGDEFWIRVDDLGRLFSSDDWSVGRLSLDRRNSYRQS